MQDASIPQESLLQLETMIEKDTSVENSAVEEGVRDGEDEEDDHDNKTSELLGFNFPLFPASSIFGANAMFQKLQGRIWPMNLRFSLTSQVKPLPLSRIFTGDTRPT